MKVVVGFLPQPIAGASVVQMGFFDSFFNFATQDATGRGIFGGYTFAATGYIPSGRNMLVDIFLTKTTGDYLLMLDWDVTFTANDVYKLVDAASETKIVSGCYVTYFGADNALRPCWMERVGDQECVPVTTFTPNEIIPLSVCGMGFTLMHRAALEKIGEAYKDDPWRWFGHDVIGGNRCGEDLTFCHRARSVGLTIWGHGGVQLGHTKAKMLTPTDMLNAGVNTSVPHEDRVVLNLGGTVCPPEFTGWRHVSLDINPDTKPDICADARKLDEVVFAEKFDAVACSHNLEHYEPEEGTRVLASLLGILKDGGEVHVRVPDMGSVESFGMDDVVYVSPAGPITKRDMTYGHQASINAGNEYMRHLTGFTAPTLEKALVEAGFSGVRVDAGNYELRATGVK